MNKNGIKHKHLEESKKYKGGEKGVREDKGDENAKEISASAFTVSCILLVYLDSIPLSSLSLNAYF